MQSQAQVVHRTRDRIRLRIPQRRKDIPYFLDLYEDLRAIPGVGEVVINPATASVLLHCPGDSDGSIHQSLRQIGLLSTEEEQEHTETGRIGRFFAGNNSRATHVRAVLLLIMVGMAVHQFRRGKIFTPLVSVLWSAYDLVSSHKREKAVLEPDPEPPPTQSA